MKVESAEGRDMRRKLAVILASDVAGYSRLVAAGEEDTVRRFRAAATAFFERVQKWRQPLVQTTTDAILPAAVRTSRTVPRAHATHDTQHSQNTALSPPPRRSFSPQHPTP